MFPVYRIVNRGWITLDAVDRTSVDGVDEAVAVLDALEAAEARLRRRSETR